VHWLLTLALLALSTLPLALTLALGITLGTLASASLALALVLLLHVHLLITSLAGRVGCTSAHWLVLLLRVLAAHWPVKAWVHTLLVVSTTRWHTPLLLEPLCHLRLKLCAALILALRK